MPGSAEQSTGPGPSEQVEGKVRVYTCTVAVQWTCTPVQPPEIMNAVTSCLLGSWSASVRHGLRREKIFPGHFARKQNDFCTNKVVQIWKLSFLILSRWFIKYLNQEFRSARMVSLKYHTLEERKLKIFSAFINTNPTQCHQLTLNLCRIRPEFATVLGLTRLLALGLTLLEHWVGNILTFWHYINCVEGHLQLAEQTRSRPAERDLNRLKLFQNSLTFRG